MKSIAYTRGSDGSADASLMTVSNIRSPGASTILTNTVANVPSYFFGSMGTPHTFTDPITSETITVISEATAVNFAGHVDSGHIDIIAIDPGYTDLGSAVGDIIIVRPTTEWANNIFNVFSEAHNDDGTLKSSLSLTTPTITSPTMTTPPANVARIPGEIVDYAGVTAPSGWFLCYGQTVSRTTYSDLFGAIVPSLGAFTVTVATPAVVTLTAHGLTTGSAVYLTTTGALPTGLSANTLYYAVFIDANTFNLSTSRANAYAGTKINTTGTQSGTHSLRRCPYGLGDGSTTFTIPDARGRVAAGSDAMGGTAASRLTLADSAGSYGNIGSSGGAETASHNLSDNGQAQISVNASGTVGVSERRIATASYTNTNATTATNAGGNSSATSTGAALAGTTDIGNNVQPTLVTNKIIKY